MEQFLVKQFPGLPANKIKYLAERIQKSCHIYVINNNLPPQMEACKLDFICKKIKNDKSIIHSILEGKTRVQYYLNTQLYDHDPILQSQRQKLIESQSSDDKKGSSNYRCPKCGKRNHTEVQVMTRAGDEATSIKCVCLECMNTFWA